jgi:hypothetical protein
MSGCFGFLGVGEECVIIIHLCVVPRLYYYNAIDGRDRIPVS